MLATTLSDMPLRQADLFEQDRYGVLTSQEVEAAIDANAPFFAAVSGGKDSQALAYRSLEYLDAVGHAGPRYLIHADLGRVEWRESLPTCERIARRTGVELIVVRRAAGGLLERWQSRWEANCARYRALSCVRLIMPWSSSALRFCTSETKSSPIASEIRRRYPRGTVISALGIRREESSARSKRPISAHDSRLRRKHGDGLVWHPILAWTRDEVLRYVAQRGDALHEAYTRFGSTRVSCAFCILASLNDLQAAAHCAQNSETYREMVELEICSTFAFQADRWLGDIAPDLLDTSTHQRLLEAKERAAARKAAEASIPRHMLFQQGWPTAMPTLEEAAILANVRGRVATAVGMAIDHTTPEQIIERYAALLGEHRSIAAARTR